MKSDVIVLGAGMVGISAALHLQKRGRTVALIDRRGAAEETSYGNGGIIQREGVVPYMFPRELGTILHYATEPRARGRLSSLRVAHGRALAVPPLAGLYARRQGGERAGAATACGALHQSSTSLF